MTIKETRGLYWGNVRAYCIKNDLYSAGTNEEYAKMLDYVQSLKNVTPKALYKIAKDIKDHSKTHYEITDLMFDLAKQCTSFFEINE